MRNLTRNIPRGYTLPPIHVTIMRKADGMWCVAAYDTDSGFRVLSDNFPSRDAGMKEWVRWSRFYERTEYFPGFR